MSSLADYERKGIEVVFVNREETFTIKVKGLLPLTYHYVYVEEQKVNASKLRPLGGDYGDALKSDSEGGLGFEFVYDTGLSDTSTSISDAERLSASFAKPEGVELIVTNLSSNTLPTDYKDASLSLFPTKIQTSVYIPTDEADWQVVKR